MMTTATTNQPEGRLKLLVIDDDALEIVAVRRTFHQARIDCAIIGASDGEHALTILSGGGGEGPLLQPVLVLLDLNMPRMNGFEFLDALRKDPVLKDTVVFVLSTSEDPEDIRNAYEYGIAGYIPKRRSGPGHRNLVSLISHYGTLIELPSDKDGVPN